MLAKNKKFFADCSLGNIKPWFDHLSILQRIGGYILLSWLFALSAQIIIPLPFNLVPLVLNPFPLLLAAHLFGMHAVYAYGLYLAQGACGLPFFLGFQSGLMYLLGPTGGYTFGFAAAMFFLAVTQTLFSASRSVLFVKLICCAAIYFACGLIQLSFFVQPQALFKVGLYPFIVGDACKLLAIVILFGDNSRHFHR